ncbi:hypothetical protein OIU85_000925 [Salix viminalis]|uniref:MADS-box domain-containing protein n=1 Tax=Salix viminalis TaxID=40686 RepID=A0A9Q0VMM6_SALVM|nr:hypothetical protein OIU85_000925 [Salix viminalis]KAJ6750341.1 hypothetical protein OIU85_000925 [Salix viminalis]
MSRFQNAKTGCSRKQQNFLPCVGLKQRSSSSPSTGSYSPAANQTSIRFLIAILLKQNGSPNNFPSLIKNNVENQLGNKQEYAESLKRLEEEQTVAKMIGSMKNMNGGGFWWDLPIDNMEQDELEAYRESMEELKKNLIARLGLIESTCNALTESRIANPFINLKEIPSSLSFNSHQCQ